MRLGSMPPRYTHSGTSPPGRSVHHGYLTAYSLWAEAGSGPVSKGDVLGGRTWIDSYCQKTPLDTVANAIERLIYAILVK